MMEDLPIPTFSEAVLGQRQPGKLGPIHIPGLLAVLIPMRNLKSLPMMLQVTQ